MQSRSALVDLGCIGKNTVCLAVIVAAQQPWELCYVLLLCHKHKLCLLFIHVRRIEDVCSMYVYGFFFHIIYKLFFFVLQSRSGVGFQ